ncbi:MAG TPA: ABC transporter substrate-binding protein [Bryobacteraceae bacterium]|nr:ABC transporter substrate-binding protein [Bryobacteraceae bacterium]
MRLRAWAWLALSSAWLGAITGATRPRYGGALTVDISNASIMLDPMGAHGHLFASITETLVRVGARGMMEPQLALAWQHEPDNKRWRFSLRPKVTFHDGEPLTANSAAPALLAALKKKYGDVTVTAGGQTLIVQFEHPMPGLLAELARPETAIFRKSGTNPMIGTGPFRVAAWELGRRLTLAAFEEYWGGRPFLDSIVISLGTGSGRADVFDIPFGSTRRVVPEGTHIWASPPSELIALLSTNPQSTLLQALSLAIDRAPIVNVLTQRRGEAAFGILPQWLSGYAFLFQTAPDPARARQLISQLRLPSINLTYPANDSFARSVADRVALNARDASIAIQPTANPGGSLTLVRWPLESADATAELSKLLGLLGAAEHAASIDPTNPETLFEAERAMLDDHRIIPLVYLPELYGLSPRVHNWEAAQQRDPFRLNLENLWVDQ